MSENSIINIPDSAVKFTKEIYDDSCKQTIKESSRLLSRIPRIINAAFAPIDNWIAKREYNVKETKLLLEEKLYHYDSNKIVPPEPYVAIPAVQALSYSMDNKILRNMYANLLAKSMYVDTKNYVHPSFVDSIKQMSPVDANIFSNLLSLEPYAIVDLIEPLNILEDIEFINEPECYGSYNLLETNISGFCISDHIVQSASFSLLQKLGFIVISDESLDDEKLYSEILSSKEFTSLNKKYLSTRQTREKRKNFYLTDLGKLFSDICVNDSVLVKLP